MSFSWLLLNLLLCCSGLAHKMAKAQLYVSPDDDGSNDTPVTVATYLILYMFSVCNKIIILFVALFNQGNNKRRLQRISAQY